MDLQAKIADFKERIEYDEETISESVSQITTNAKHLVGTTVVLFAIAFLSLYAILVPLAVIVYLVVKQVRLAEKLQLVNMFLEMDTERRDELVKELYS